MHVDAHTHTRTHTHTHTHTHTVTRDLVSVSLEGREDGMRQSRLQKVRRSLNKTSFRHKYAAGHGISCC